MAETTIGITMSITLACAIHWIEKGVYGDVSIVTTQGIQPVTHNDDQQHGANKSPNNSFLCGEPAAI